MEKSKRKIALDYFITSFNGMALGLFSTLIVGVIIGQLGNLVGEVSSLSKISEELLNLSTILKSFMGIGIGVGMAVSLKLDGLKLVATSVAGGVASRLYNDPMVIYITVSLVYFFLRYAISKKTPIDILLIPFSGLMIGFLVAYLIGSPISESMKAFGTFIDQATTLQPFFMGIVISVVMGMALTAPISSAAIAIAISLGGIAGGAAVVGCSVQMVGFAVMSRKDNNIGSVISVFIGTSMLQFKNILKKPIIWLPTILVSAILGPISTVLFKIETGPTGAGMGTSGLVGQLVTFDVMGYSVLVVTQVVLLHIILPLVLIYVTDYFFRKYQLIKPGDLTI
ncbi:conserved hypothetical protein [Paracholeplasma brassicae]|uniref:Phosphotransferase system EIIC domain-containing protein n=1 Tax=Acholeplasma brassicae TaxID=61635 RepID=U4KRW4_9MOLU|nr:PTS sugar transporter subunit IIC [Paracholeplasma brassicae]CCV66118.1 conserved hypothetical protein [Paracholeplasma brassicae]